MILLPTIKPFYFVCFNCQNDSMKPSHRNQWTQGIHSDNFLWSNLYVLDNFSTCQRSTFRQFLQPSRNDTMPVRQFFQISFGNFSNFRSATFPKFGRQFFPKQNPFSELTHFRSGSCSEFPLKTSKIQLSTINLPIS